MNNLERFQLRYYVFKWFINAEKNGIKTLNYNELVSLYLSETGMSKLDREAVRHTMGKTIRRLKSLGYVTSKEKGRFCLDYTNPKNTNKPINRVNWYFEKILKKRALRRGWD